MIFQVGQISREKAETRIRTIILNFLSSQIREKKEISSLDLIDKLTNAMLEFASDEVSSMNLQEVARRKSTELQKLVKFMG